MPQNETAQACFEARETGKGWEAFPALPALSWARCAGAFWPCCFWPVSNLGSSFGP